MNDMRERLIELITTDFECTKDGHGDCLMCEYQYADNKCERYFAAVIADHFIANGVTVQEWISVEDRLPDKPMKCLVYTIGEDIGRLDIAYYGGYYDGFSLLHGTVTHWMPLTHPPKGE